MNIHPNEFVSARDASRSLGELIDRLQSGELDKAVIVFRNKPRAILYPFGPDFPEPAPEERNL